MSRALSIRSNNDGCTWNTPSPSRAGKRHRQPKARWAPLAAAELSLADAARAGQSLLVGLTRARATVLPAVPPLAMGLARLLAVRGSPLQPCAC